MTTPDRIWITLMNLGHRMGCHQIPERSFSFKGYQFPVCARCTGVFFGEIITIIILIAQYRISPWLSLFFMLVMGIDWGLQYLDILPSTNIRRLVSGLFGGVGLTNYYFLLLHFCIQLLM